jgi:hypothetical protein
MCMQQLASNRYLAFGLLMAVVTAATATLGAPKGLEELTVPVWDILLQFNLCSSFVFIIVGVLKHMETPMPDFKGPLRLKALAFSAYILATLASTIGLDVDASIKLFLFVTAIACIGAAWAIFGVSVLKQLDR